MSMGYPGVTGTKLPDSGAVNKTTIDGKPYLCVSYEVEKTQVQPLRLAAGLIGGPVVIYAATKLPPAHGTLKAMTTLVGLGVSVWSLWIWSKADTAMREAP